MPEREQAVRPGFPRPPAYAWDWLQRSRPVLLEAADQLIGGPPGPGFVDDLRARFEEDAFTRDVLVAVIADVAFGGRVPTRRPAGSSWDRGLTWWAAALAGATPREFEARGTGPAQEPLFGAASEADPAVASGDAAVVDREAAVAWLVARAPARSALVARLRDLLAQAEGDSVPAGAVRDLLRELEDDAR